MTRLKLLIFCVVMSFASTLKANDNFLYFFELVNSTKEYLITIGDQGKQIYPGEKAMIGENFNPEYGTRFGFEIDYAEDPSPSKGALGAGVFTLSGMITVNFVSLEVRAAHGPESPEIHVDMVSSVLPTIHSRGTISWQDGLKTMLAVPYTDSHECKVTVTFSE